MNTIRITCGAIALLCAPMVATTQTDPDPGARERRVDVQRRANEPAPSPVPAPAPTPAPTRGDRDPPAADRAARVDRDLGAAADTYERVYDRLSYGDEHLRKQLATNERRRDEIDRLLARKKRERIALEERVTDQFTLVRRRYPPPESNEIVVELASEYDATRQSLDDEIATLREDLRFAEERIGEVRKQLRRVQARSIGRDVRARAAGQPVASPEETETGRTFAQLERLRARVAKRRVDALLTLRVEPLDPATCGRAGDFRTRVFRAVR